MTERFRIDIVRKNFISFNPRRVPDDDKDRFNPRIIWPFVHDNVLVDREIDDLRGNGFEFHFPGRIKIVLRESEIPGFVVGRGFDTMGADAAHGGYQIPSAKITTNIRANKSSFNLKNVNCIKPCAIHCKLDKVRHIVPCPSREPLEDVINGLCINGQLEQVDRDWYRFSLPVSSKSEP